MLTQYDSCKCIANKRNHALCFDSYSVDEEGKKAKLVPKTGENVEVFAFDDCICTDSAHQKCDALFLFINRSNQAYLISVELKGTDWEHALEQLAHTKHLNPNYSRFKVALAQSINQIKEKAVLITSAAVDKSSQKKIEKALKIRVYVKSAYKATDEIFDLRLFL